MSATKHICYRLQRCFKRSGWKTTKEDFIRELRSAYAIAKLTKTGYSKNKFYIEALKLYKEKFEAYDSKGSVVAVDKKKEVLVRDI
ncbi:unnamed protein product [Brassica rapa subsp. trilocularis]